MNNRNIVFPLLLTAGCGSAMAAGNKDLKLPENGEKPRNIVFILSDDHRFDYMGFMHTIPWLETPNMDRMAAEGAHMKNAFVTTSLSSPSRASILTGLYSHMHKVVDNMAPLPDGLTFFPEYLQQAGYTTAYFGKWHMGNDTGDPQPGFDHWEGVKGQGQYWNPRLNVNGKWIQYADSTYLTDLITDHAIRFIKEQQSAGHPFFVYLSHKGVHDPFEAPARYRGCYKDKEFPLPVSYENPHYGMTQVPNKNPETGEPLAGKAYYGEHMKPDWVKEQRESWHGVDYSYHGRRSWIEEVRKYCETLRSVDESIGQVLAALEELGIADDTLVIYMGDNGFCWGEHGLIDKRQFYEESVRVPMLVRCPDLFEGGTVVEKMVQNVDIAPTILSCAGLEKPEQMVGESFVPLLQGKDIPWRDRIFYEYYWEFEFPQTPTMHGVRTDKYKYIRYHGIWDTNEFYDLENDPHEMHNLIDDPKYRPIIKQLNHELYNWLEQTDGMTIPLKRTEAPHTDHRNKKNF